MPSTNHEFTLDSREPLSDSSETHDPHAANAYRWLQVTQYMLTERIKQYEDVNNFEAAQYLRDLHQATLDMLRAGVERNDKEFIAMLSGFEVKLSDRSDPNLQRPSYGVDHALQLDEIALAVGRAQEQYDSSS